MSYESSYIKLENVYNFNSPVYLVKAANGSIIALTKNILIRFTLNKPSSFEEIKIPVDDDLGHSLFIDPTGNHVIVCMQSSQSFYLAKSSKKVRLIREAKGILIESVGWNIKQSSENSTSNILIGTSNGELIETKLSNNNTESYWNKIYIFEHTITGILFDCYPDSNGFKYFLIITTPTSLFPIFINLSPSYTKGNVIFTPEFERISLKGGIKCTTFPFNFGYSDLGQFYNHEKQFPAFISWMNGAGIYYATVNDNSIEAEAGMLLRPKLLYYSEHIKQKPINVANTEYHVILQYSDVIDIFCIIQEKNVHSIRHDLSNNDKFRGMCKDHSTGHIFTYTNTKLMRVNCDGELKNLWRTYLKIGDFTNAYSNCDIDEEKVKIRLKRAETLYEEKRYVEAGEYFANTTLSFEEVTLKFIDLENKEGLKSYLLTYLTQLKPGSVDQQNSFDVICMWMLEIFFEEINAKQFKTGKEITNEDFKNMEKDYYRFVEEPQITNSLKRNKSLIYEKIKNYGDLCQSAIFAEIIGDNMKIIEHYLDKRKIKKALAMLEIEKSVKCHYMFGPKIIETHPNELVDLWIKISHRLESKKILPILRTIDDEIAIKYVRHMVKKDESNKLQVMNSKLIDASEMHHFYILLCAKLAHKHGHQTNSKNDELMNYLEKQGINSYQTIYEPQIALRISTEWDHVRASVFLYCLLDKHRDAVDLALGKKNVELAQEVALHFSGSEEVKKFLWFQIAKFIIEDQKDVEEVCRLVKNQHSLKLVDILPHFPDFVKIDDFANTICDSIKFYNEHIENLEQDMNVANEYANKTREEINVLKKRPICVPRDTKCAHCHELLTQKPFCLFPCRHFFHLNCLESVVTLIESLNLDSEILKMKQALILSPDDQNVKNEYYKILSIDCCYCGSNTIDIIDKPIITFKEFDNEMMLWD